jgi:hypothetical protein
MIRKRRKPRPGRLAGAALEALRQACFDRAGERCQECHCLMLYRRRYELDPIAYEMAHVRGKRMWGDSLDQVRALCHVCHHASHNPKPCPKKEVAA